MAITVEAVYEDGVLKPAQPLPLKEHERVRLTVEPSPNWVESTAGMFGWKGTPEEAEYLATDPELAFPPHRSWP